MFKIFKNIVASLLIAIFFLYGGGIVIYRHICDESKIDKISVFNQIKCTTENYNQKAKELPSCCEKAEKHNCCSNKSNDKNNNSCKNLAYKVNIDTPIQTTSNFDFNSNIEIVILHFIKDCDNNTLNLSFFHILENPQCMKLLMRKIISNQYYSSDYLIS